MGKSRQQYEGGHYSRRGYSKDDLYKGPEPSGYAGMNRHALYESAVQSPKGDISYLLCFYQRYIGQQVPEHLREDFCGTALLASTWCRGDVARRTAMGLDIDRGALMWGMQHNGEGLCNAPQPCLWLLHGDVTQPLDRAVLVTPETSSIGSQAGELSLQQGMQEMNLRSTAEAAPRIPGSSCMRHSLGSIDKSADSTADSEQSIGGQDGSAAEHELSHNEAGAHKAADIICAFNFSVCLLHGRSEVQAYLRQSRQAMSRRGGIFVMDLLGGHAAEESVLMHRHNDSTGASFVWEQEGFNPVTRHIHAYITLKDPDTKKNLRRAFQYHWRLWTIPELHEMLFAAGFNHVHVWLRPMQIAERHFLCFQGVSSGEEEEDSAGESEEQHHEEDFEEYNAKTMKPKTAELLNKGWTAFIVGVALPL